MSEMLTKLADAGSMFWASLDARERLLVLYGAATVLYLLSLAASRSAEQERERRLVERLRAEVLDGR